MVKKHLGQNFLKSKKAINKMVEVSKIGQSDIVIEIGPGKGAITEPLLEKAKLVIALEKDIDLIPELQEKFKNYKNFKLLHCDVLEFDTKNPFLKDDKYKIVANIPYYITGAIFEHFLENDNPPTSMTLLVQKEVAERIVARNKKESILSLSIKAYGEVSIALKVGREYFSPKPKVDSAIIHIESISKSFFSDFSEKDFFRIIKQAFQFKRKTLHNNLKTNFPEIDKVLIDHGFTKKTRAEDINLSEWKKIIKVLL